MLAIARERAGATDLSATATFVQGDLRELDLSGGEETTHSRAFHPHPSSLIPHPSSFDLVTCTYDSLNYLLTEDDLARCFDGVAQALAWGGVFYADMNTGHFLAYDWPACEVLERNGFIQVAQSWFDPQTNSSTMRLTGFSGDDEHGYTRFDETHIERAYPPAIIAGLLTSAGLHVEAAYECFTFMPHHEQSQRIAWIARKPNQDKNSTA
jgi:SAM-dependent methyltransferase